MIKHMPIDSVYLTDTIFLHLPYAAELLVNNKFPHKGDILKTERNINVRNDTPFVTKKLFVAAETLQEPKPVVVQKPVAPPPPPTTTDIAEDVQLTDLGQQVADQLQKGGPGQAIVVRGINFDNGYHTIRKSVMPTLDAVIEALKKYPNVKLEIQGHVCCWPLGEEGFDNETKEYSLSDNRARAVYDYFVSHGILKSRLTFKGYGMKFPLVYPEKGKKDEYQNRRVVFKIISK
jgi:outer membrane protein OmpA-like peptidoglycan-associated protein